ncbi:MAG: hypothetical protein QM758_08175 [Armatimonas sp.]
MHSFLDDNGMNPYPMDPDPYVNLDRIKEATSIHINLDGADYGQLTDPDSEFVTSWEWLEIGNQGRWPDTTIYNT